ncbi:MAG: hypothetical protein F7C07_01100 [Desulfurococcales archaeon]|nr:hypothetical protein [Desulfurococcales archaeon]
MRTRISLPYIEVVFLGNQKQVSLESYFYKYVEPINICFLVHSWDLAKEPWGKVLAVHDDLDSVIRGYQAKIAELRRMLEEIYPREFRKHYRFRAIVEVARVFFGASSARYDLKEANRLALSLRLCNYALGDDFAEKARVVEARIRWRNLMIEKSSEDKISVLDHKGEKVKSLSYLLQNDEGFRREILNALASSPS